MAPQRPACKHSRRHKLSEKDYTLKDVHLGPCQMSVSQNILHDLSWFKNKVLYQGRFTSGENVNRITTATRWLYLSFGQPNGFEPRKSWYDFFIGMYTRK